MAHNDGDSRVSPMHSMSVEMSAGPSNRNNNVGSADDDYGITEEQLTFLDREGILEQVRPEYNDDGLVSKRFLVTSMALAEAEEKEKSLYLNGDEQSAAGAVPAKSSITHPSKVESSYKTQLHRSMHVDTLCRDLNNRDMLHQDAVQFLTSLGYEVITSFETCGLVNLPTGNQTHIGRGICLLTNHKSKSSHIKYLLHFYHFHRTANLKSDLTFRYEKVTTYCCGFTVGTPDEMFSEFARDKNSRLTDAIYGTVDVGDILKCSNFTRVHTEIDTTSAGSNILTRELKLQEKPQDCCDCCCIPNCKCCTVEGVSEFSNLVFTARHELDLKALTEEKMVHNRHGILYEASNRFNGKETSIKGNVDMVKNQKTYSGLEITYVDVSSGKKCQGLALLSVAKGGDNSSALKLAGQLQDLIQDVSKDNDVLPNGTFRSQLFPVDDTDPYHAIGLDRDPLKVSSGTSTEIVTEIFTTVMDTSKLSNYLIVVITVTGLIMSGVGLEGTSSTPKYLVNLASLFTCLISIVQIRIWRWRAGNLITMNFSTASIMAFVALTVGIVVLVLVQVIPDCSKTNSTAKSNDVATPTMAPTFPPTYSNDENLGAGLRGQNWIISPLSSTDHRYLFGEDDTSGHVEATTECNPPHQRSIDATIGAGILLIILSLLYSYQAYLLRSGFRK